MDHTQEALFDPGSHEHVYRITRGPYETYQLITLSSGTKWCWTCGQWITEMRDGRWLSYSERTAENLTWRDEKRNS